MQLSSAGGTGLREGGITTKKYMVASLCVSLCFGNKIGKNMEVLLCCFLQLADMRE